MKLHSSRIGKGRAPMLMIHCALARSEALLRLASAFAEDHQITLVDLPSHGRSPDFAPEEDVHRLARDGVLALLDGPTHLIGHSFGGTIALRIAIERPELVSRLTLIEPVYFKAAEGRPGHDLHTQSWVPIEAAFDAQNMAEAAQHFLAIWGGGAPFETLPTRQKDMILRGLPLVSSSSRAVYFDADETLGPGQLEAVRCPVALIEGAESPPVIAEINAALAARLPDATRHVVPGAGHMVPISHPGEVAALIRAGLG